VAEHPYNLVEDGIRDVELPKVDNRISVRTVLLVPNPGQPKELAERKSIFVVLKPLTDPVAPVAPVNP
jgi:hypothetical protein